MDNKKDICELWQKASSLITDVSKSADMTSNIKILESNGERLKERAKKMVNHLIKVVDTFYNQLEKSVETIVGQKKALLEYHALEVQQYVSQIKTLCNTAECYIQGYSVHIAQYGPKLKKELEHCIDQAGEFNSVDYETFTSLELESDLDNLIKVPLCNIVSLNKQNNEKEILKAIYLDYSLLIDLMDKEAPPETKESQNNLANNSVADVVVKPSESVPKPQVNICNNTVTVPSSTSSLTNYAAKFVSKTSPQAEERKILNDQNQYCKDLEAKTKESYAATNSPFLSSNGLLPGKPVSTLQEGQPKNSRAEEPYSKKSSVQSNFIGTSSNQTLEKSISEDFAACKIIPKSIIEEAPPKNSRPEEPSLKKNSVPSNFIGASSNQIPVKKIAEDFAACKITPKSTFEEAPPKNSRPEEPSLKKNSVPSNFIGASSNQIPVKSIAEDFAACKISPKSEVKELIEQSSTVTGDSMEMSFDLRAFMKTSPCSANEIEAQLIRRIKDCGGGGTFDHPTGLTVSNEGQLIVADTGNNLVKVLEDTHLVFTIGGKDGVDFHRPSAVVCDAVGNIYVKDDRCIRMFNSKGNYLHTIGKGVLQCPYGLSLTEVDDDNVLVLIDVGKRAQSVFHYNINRDELLSYRYQPLLQLGMPNSKVRFLATYKDLMLASDLGASSMYLTTTKGECLNAFGGFGHHAGNFKEPSGVTVDSSGNWIVGDSKNNRLQIFNKDGDFLAHIKLSCPIRRPSGIHLTNDGKLFVINYLDCEILVFQLY